MEVFLGILLVVITVLLLVLGIIYLAQKKKLRYYETISQNISAMKVIQSMFEILSANISSKKKFEELNQIIIGSYSPKYSTISIFDGNSYEIKASNVESTYLEVIGQIAEENDFRNNTIKNISKYLTTTREKPLSYKSAVERGIRSCMFSPIFHNGMYLGFWLLEDDKENAFDYISKSELSKLKNNLGVFVENTIYQNMIENAENKDKQTGLYNNLYLYSNVRNVLEKNEESSFVMFVLDNIPEINEKYGRNFGNKLLIKTLSVIKEMADKDSIHIRYSGIRFISIFTGKDAQTIYPVVENILKSILNQIEYFDSEQVKVNVKVLIHTFKKQNNVEKEVQKMVKYMDSMQDINVIKII